ncbi:hypothetical protein BC830DRAFT_861244 [Chytriomyces sp. MP71]|nr:hypothetical protein BC830DRAFT_861244 [Chytriomyces sp. MP71]
MDDDTPDTSVPIDTEINDNDIEAHLEASARSGNAKDDGAEGADTIEDLLEGETLDSAIEKANGKATSAEEDDGRPTTNKALEILGSIIRNHDAFDVAKEEAEIQELVNVAMEDPHPAEDGDGPPKEMSEEERIMYQIKDTIRFLQENVKQPAPNEDLSSVGVGDAKFDVKMRVEYEKLYRIFIAARRNNQGLVKKLRDLKNEIISNATKVEAAMNIFQQDRILIASLKKELKKAWSIVELSKDRELKAKDTVFNLKFEIENLKREFATASENSGFAYAARGVSGGINMVQLNMEQQKKIEELEQEKVELNNRWQTSLSDIRVLNEDIHELTVKIDVLKSDKAAAFREMDIVNGILQTKKSDQDRESRIRDKLETQIKEQAENIKAKEALVADKVSKMKSTQEVVARLEMQVRDEKLKCEKEVNEKNAAISRILRLQQEMDEQFAASTQGAPKASSQPHPESSELARYREEIRTLTRARDGYQKQVKQLEEAKLGVEVERDTIKGTNYSLVRETDSMKKQVESCAHQIEMLTKERDAAQKNFVKATGATQKQLNAVKISDQAQRTLEHEIIGFKEEAAKMRKLIYSLERDRDHHMTEYNKVQDDLGMKDEQLKMKEMLIFDGRKKITELERKRKEQQQLYESVRTDRNLYSKNLIECEDEITELKRKLKIMGHQIEQLKEEIAMKEFGEGSL